MQNWLLGDKLVQEGINRYLREARISAQTSYPVGEGGVLGIPTMLTVLACVDAVGEALAKSRSTEKAFRAFYEAMENKTSWIEPPEGITVQESEVVKHLLDTRHSMVHTLCLPPDVELVQNRQWRKRPSYWGLYLVELIDEVEKTALAVTKENPDLKWDPTNSDKPRGPVGIVQARRRGEFNLATIAYDTLGETSCGSIATFDEEVSGDHNKQE